MEFDKRGFLKPYEISRLSLSEFELTFVKSHKNSKTRVDIFNDLVAYQNAFREEIHGNFVQWIDGSFISTESNPRDIDVVTFVDFEIFDQKKELLEKSFGKFKSEERFKFVDAYLIKRYPKDHNQFFVTDFDSKFWFSFFSKTKKNWKKEQFPKGFVELKID